MGTTLTGTTPQDTYDSLIKVTDNGPLSGTAKYLSDGLGNDSKLALSTGNIGINTTTPDIFGRFYTYSLGLDSSGSTAFQIDGTSYSIIDMGANGVRLGFLSQSATETSLGNLSTIPLTFQTNSAERMRITGAGNVGIGTSEPATILEVAQSSPVVRLQASASNAFHGIEFRQGAGLDVQLKQLPESGEFRISSGRSSGWGGFTSFYTDTIERVRVTNNGLTFNGDTAAANALDDYEEGTFTPTVEGSSTAGTATYSVQIGKYTKIGNQISILIDLAWSGGTGTGNLRIVGLPFTNVAFNTAGTIGFIDSIALTASNYATMYVAPSSTRLDFVQSPTGGGSVTDVPYDAAGRLIVSATYFNA